MSDNFSDGDFDRAPRWSVTSGEYWVEKDYGLRARVTAAAASGGSSTQKLSKEQLAISILGAVGFVRAYLTSRSIIESLAISVSLAVIVVVAVALGSLIPILLRRFNIDPAFSAGPFLATLMDILGVFIYCSVSGYILSGLLT